MPVLHYALSGGEDYELLFTVPPGKTKRLRSLNLPVTEIGTVKRGKTVLLVDDSNRKSRLKPEGYDHFRRTNVS